MKTNTPHSIPLILMVFCVLTFVNTYGQDKKIFGQTVKTSSINPSNGKIRCATTEYEQFLQEKNPERMSNEKFETWLSPLVEKQNKLRANFKVAATIIKIPVVVHVVCNGQAIGTAPNITNAQVLSQITILNQDYRKMVGTPGDNTNPVGADVEIEFVLATQDPNGNPTNGIDRVSFSQSTWSGNDIETILKPATIWDPTLYLNMWSLKFSDTKLLGYAQFPDGSGLGGLSASGGTANTDGVVSSYDVFGSSTYTDGTFLLASNYDKGRTMTHEVGHWLGLRHIWGDGDGDESKNIPDCNATDYCNDTPQAAWEHYTCGPFDSCPASPGSDMPENYMDYTRDDCMNIFTQGQKNRITTIINNAARRKSLKTSTKAVAIPLFAKDAEVKIATFNSGIIYPCSTPAPAPTNKQITISNRGTSTLTAATINYTINGGANQTYSWTGSLVQDKSEIVTLPNTNVYGTLNVSIAAFAGADERASNNTATKNYFDIVPINYNYTNYTFRLQQDFFGSETLWILRDSAGATVYEGGPYTDSNTLPALITQNWVLKNNECYTFTIDDTQSDGICCGEGGDGYYNIKTNNDAITVKSGASFLGTEVVYFTTNSLGTREFASLDEISLYPNPTKGILNVNVPSSLGLPTSLTISNTLGQVVSKKTILKQADLSVNTSSLSTGVYFITVTKEGQTKTLQFIKN